MKDPPCGGSHGETTTLARCGYLKSFSLLGNAFPCEHVVAGANIALELAILEHTLAELLHRLFVPAQPAANAVVVNDIVKSVHNPLWKMLILVPSSAVSPEHIHSIFGLCAAAICMQKLACMHATCVYMYFLILHAIN